MSAAVIATKLFIPTPRRNPVPREALQQRLLQQLQGRLTLVSAPAGFGKTTLVSSAVRHCGMAVCWLSLDHQDAHLQRFISAVIAALQTARLGLAAATQQLLNSSQPVAAGVLLPTLLNELATLEQPVVLVLDDYHVLESPEVDEALGFLLEHCPPALHLVIVTREDPPLPLARLRAAGELAELREADLRFATAEAASFFNHSMGLSLSEESVAALEARTEGWIAGLQLAALSLQGHRDCDAFIQDFTGSHRFIIDYLAEEVLQQLPQSLRDFLLQTSILERFNAALCATVSGQTDATALLSQLDRQNLFLVPLDEQRQWYRYHHLFRDVLLARLQEQPIAKSELHRRASHWYEQNNDFIAAIDQSLLAQDHPQAAILIEKYWPTLRQQESESLFYGWLKSLPESVIETSPVLCSYYALTLLSFAPDAAPRWLAQAEHWQQQSPEQLESLGICIHNPEAYATLPGMVAIAKAYAAGAVGDFPTVVEQANRALACLDDSESIWRGAAAVLLGLMHWASGDLVATDTAFSDGMAAMKRGGEISGAISTGYMLTFARVAHGRHRDALRVCQQSLALVSPLPQAPQGTADLYNAMAALAIGEYNLPQARQWLAQSAELGPQARLLESAHDWYVFQAILAMLDNQFEQAADLLAEAGDVWIPSPKPDFAPIASWQTRLALLQNDLPAAGRWFSALGVGLDDESTYFNQIAQLTGARLQLQRFDQDRDTETLLPACRAVDAQLALSRQLQLHGSLQELLWLQSRLADALGDDATALSALGEAVALPEADKQRVIYVLDGQSARDWLYRAGRQLALPDWLQGLLGEDSEDQHRQPAQSGPQTALIEPLSDRERDVLRLLHSDLSGPQIAEQLFVSLNTFRTHSKNIYAKLGVNNRRAAVRLAAELGL